MTKERHQELIDEAVKNFISRSITRDHLALFSLGASYKDTLPYRDNEDLLKVLTKSLTKQAKMILNHYHLTPTLWIEPDIMLQLEAAAMEPIHG